MSLLCPACAEPNRAGARYCDHCGTSLSSGTAAGTEGRTIELRPGTVLFCDLVRSTQLANSLDVDDLRGVFRGFREIVADVAGRHSGHIIQFSGDGAFVLFGYPRAREDAAESALDSALALVERVRQAHPAGTASLDLRVGIASGTVVTGDLEREAAAFRESVIGSTVHLAARLVAKAQPGRVVIDDSTRRLTGRFFEYRDLGRLRLKGFDEGVQAWQVLRASAVASRFEAKHTDRTLPAIVGRTEPLETLRACWASAGEGHCATVIIEGDAGVGKSRLGREIRGEALQSGAIVLDIDCSPRAANTPLSPVGTLLRRMIGGRPRDSAAAAAHAKRWLRDILGTDRVDAAFPYLAPLVGITTAAADAAESPDRFRQRTIALLIDVVRALAGKRPLFILCEDMHWSDATTTEVVTRVSTEITGLPLLMVITLRSPEGDARRIDIPAATCISLLPLDAAHSAEIVRMMASEASLPPAVVAQIVNRCEGNPLYLEEATRNIVETVSDRGGDKDRPLTLRDVPMSLQGLVQTRLDRWPSLKPIVQAAAILGRDFTLPVLQLLLPDSVDLAQAIALLVDRDLLVRDGEKPSGNFRFKHALIHDAVYRTIVRSERQRLHSTTADVLARHFAGQAESAPDLLAHHLAAAQRDEEATFAFADAGDAAAARGAHVESIGHSRAALSLADRVADDRIRRHLQRRVLIRLGVALAGIEGYASPEVLTTYHRARDLCAAHDDPEELFPVVRGLGTFHFVRGDMLEAAALSEQCLSLAHRSQRADFLIEALSFRGYPAHYRGNLAESRQVLEQCLAVYRAEGGERFVYPSAQDAATAAHSLLITTTWLQGDVQGSTTATNELLAHVDRLQRPFDQAYARVWVAGLRHMQRRYDEALEHATIAIEIAQTHGYNTWLATAVMMASMATALRSASADSLDVLRATHQAFMQAGANVSASFYLWGIARALAGRGAPDEARRAVADGIRLGDAGGESYMKAELLAVAAELEPDDVQAIRLLHSALRIAEAQGAVAPALRVASWLLLRQRRGELPCDLARTCLASLDGESPCPLDSGWMSEALQVMKCAVPTSDGSLMESIVDRSQSV